MEGQKSANTSKKKERVRLYKKKVRSIREGRQYRVGRINRLKHLASKSNDKLLNLTSQITVLKKTVNTTAAHNKLLRRYIKGYKVLFSTLSTKQILNTGFSNITDNVFIILCIYCFTGS